MENKVLDTGRNTYRKEINDLQYTMELLAGKWKIHVLGSLLYGGEKRFMDLIRDIEGIGSKMLSKELNDLEKSGLVVRVVYDTRPIAIEYRLTDLGKSIGPVIDIIRSWGINYRDNILGK